MRQITKGKIWKTLQRTDHLLIEDIKGCSREFLKFRLRVHSFKSKSACFAYWVTHEICFIACEHEKESLNVFR